MKLTGISDEAGQDIAVQIKAHQELGWDSIESRFLSVEGFDKGSFHEIPQEAFDKAAGILEDSGMKVSGVGSTIGNWAHSIEDDFQITLDEIERCIPRMERLGSKIVRIMTYAILTDADGNSLPEAEQQKEERFRRTNEIVKRFADAGITAVHENCMNYGGMSIQHALETQEAVPGMKWVFDTGNPVFNPDRSKPRPFPRQDPWDFYQAVKPHIAHIHIKDGVWNESKQDCDYTFPGEGDGQVARILGDLKTNGYDGYVSIEPHMAVVFHDADGAAAKGDPEEEARKMYANYVEYGQRLASLINGLA